MNKDFSKEIGEAIDCMNQCNLLLYKNLIPIISKYEGIFNRRRDFISLAFDNFCKAKKTFEIMLTLSNVHRMFSFTMESCQFKHELQVSILAMNNIIKPIATTIKIRRKTSVHLCPRMRKHVDPDLKDERRLVRRIIRQLYDLTNNYILLSSDVF